MKIFQSLVFIILFASKLTLAQELYIEPIEVKVGDTLWDLAVKYYGDGHKFKLFGQSQRLPA